MMMMNTQHISDDDDEAQDRSATCLTMLDYLVSQYFNSAIATVLIAPWALL